MSKGQIGAIFNRDIDPSPELVEQFPRLRALVINPAISMEFRRHERAAVRLKRVHTLVGRGALVCIAAVMLFFDFDLTLGQIHPFSASLRMPAAVLGVVGVCAQFVLVFGRIKERWILQRFAAERLRCLKFQAFALAAFSKDSEDLAAKIAAFTKEQMAYLDQELMAGLGALGEFLPSEQVLPVYTTTSVHNPELIVEAFKVYEKIRLDVQAQHFDHQALRKEQRGRYPAFVSEITFALGGLLALVQVSAAAWKGASQYGDTHTAVLLSFLTLASFIISAVVAVYQRGSADTSHAERYRHYAREIHRIRARVDQVSAGSLIQTVEETEQIGLRELFDFCRDSMQSSYIF